ncbi:MAG: hypothetical protein ABI858_09310 [Pseudoxanthomonas sp.]
MKSIKTAGYLINRAGLPVHYPTHAHVAAFWEALGRAIATFGFLEEVLLKAVFAITATTQYDEEKIEDAYEAWIPTLTRSLSDPLGNLIDTYGKAVRNNSSANTDDLEGLLDRLRKACKIRNAICHGSWRAPDFEGFSVPFYVNRQGHIFDTPIDLTFLAQTRTAVSELSCSVIETVTRMGWQFPGSNGPGRVLWQKGME